jgi:hypothetical protein
MKEQQAQNEIQRLNEKYTETAQRFKSKAESEVARWCKYIFSCLP